MRIAASPKREIEPIDGGGPDDWQGLGDDPAFHIHLSFSRPPVLLMHVAALDDEEIDPKVYIDRGKGFREDDAVQLPSGRDFLIRADVGAFGNIRTLRLDPAGFPTRFRFEAHGFRSMEEAERDPAIAAALADGAAIVDLGRLSRFKLPVPRLAIRIRPRINPSRNYVRASTALAEKTPPSTASIGEGTWLSLVVPVYNAPTRYLDDLTRSFLSQNEPGAELVLSDDASPSDETRRWLEAQAGRHSAIKIVRNAENGGIARATNAGLAEATGRWIGLLDHDDVIAPHALRRVRETLAEHPDTLFLYTDEVVVDDKLKPVGLMLKPAYDPVLLSGVNYINHFSFYRRDRLTEVGNLRLGFDGSQDYDLLMRYLEGVPDRQVRHLPYPAYWWRRTGKTYSRTFIDKATAAARKSIGERFARGGHAVRVEGTSDHLHKVVFEREETDWPKVSVIIPSRNGFELISRILGDLFERTDYPDLEVIVIDNGSTDARVLALYEEWTARTGRFRAFVEEEAFNFARAVNKGIAHATGAHCLILNNDIEVIDGDWLKEMVSCLSYPKAGIVGAKLLYPSGKIQHAGVIAGFGGLAGHWYLNRPRNYAGPMHRLHLRNSMTCVTGAAMLVSGECLRAIGAWDEENFAVAYNDVDYCLRAYQAGYRVIWTPFSCLYHHESATRGSDEAAEKKPRFEQEKENLRRKHGTETFIDPALSPAYGRRHSDPSVQMPDKLFASRLWF